VNVSLELQSVSAAVVGRSSPYLEICRPVEMPRLSSVVVVVTAVCGHNCTCERAKIAVPVAHMSGGLPVGQDNNKQRTTNTEQQTANTTSHTRNPRNASQSAFLSR